MAHMVAVRYHTLPDKIYSRSRTVAMGLLCEAQERRHTVITSRQIALNQTGVPSLDSLTIEYNSLLALPEWSHFAHEAMISFFIRSDDKWDEFIWSGVDEGLVSDSLHTNGLTWLCIQNSNVRYVDLELLRSQNRTFQDSLSANTRHQIRKAIRELSSSGEVTVEAASNVFEREDWLEKLIELHQRHWNKKGFEGAFGTEKKREFHHSLVTKCAPKGRCEILRVSAGSLLLGYLYNFIYRDRVLNYQSGFDYSLNPKLKPGLVSHCAAIEHWLDLGAEAYDFLAGDSQYKRSLSNRSTQMSWWIIQKPLMRFRVENKLRNLKSTVFQNIKKIHPSKTP